MDLLVRFRVIQKSRLKLLSDVKTRYKHRHLLWASLYLIIHGRRADPSPTWSFRHISAGNPAPGELFEPLLTSWLAKKHQRHCLSFTRPSPFTFYINTGLITGLSKEPRAIQPLRHSATAAKSYTLTMQGLKPTTQQGNKCASLNNS